MTITASTTRKIASISESDAKEMILDSYVMHIGSQRCKNCDCIERYSTLFEVWIHPTKTHTTGLTSLRIATEIKNLPIGYLELPLREIPLCSDCIETFEPEGEKPIPAVSREAWTATLRRKYAPKPKESARARNEPSLDQL